MSVRVFWDLVSEGRSFVDGFHEDHRCLFLWSSKLIPELTGRDRSNGLHLGALSAPEFGEAAPCWGFVAFLGLMGHGVVRL